MFPNNVLRVEDLIVSPLGVEILSFLLYIPLPILAGCLLLYPPPHPSWLSFIISPQDPPSLPRVYFILVVGIESLEAVCLC